MKRIKKEKECLTKYGVLTKPKSACSGCGKTFSEPKEHCDDCGTKPFEETQDGKEEGRDK